MTLNGGSHQRKPQIVEPNWSFSPHQSFFCKPNISCHRLKKPVNEAVQDRTLTAGKRITSRLEADNVNTRKGPPIVACQGSETKKMSKSAANPGLYLVTGTSRGFGSGIIQALHSFTSASPSDKLGPRIFGVARTMPPQSSSNGKPWYHHITGDLTRDDTVTKIIQKLRKSSLPLKGVILNAA